MKTSLIFLSLASTVCGYTPVDKEYVKIMHTQWMEEFNKNYTSCDEHAKRLEIFENNVHFILPM